MNLFIKIQDGQPINHPILESNLKQLIPNLDINNLPPDYARFERVPAPLIGIYETNQRVVYEQGEDGIYRDVWYVDQMTEEEKLAKQNTFKEQWVSTGFASWIFNETTCSFDPPIPYPDDGKKYVWDEDTVSWIEHVVEV